MVLRCIFAFLVFDIFLKIVHVQIRVQISHPLHSSTHPYWQPRTYTVCFRLSWLKPRPQKGIVFGVGFTPARESCKLHLDTGWECASSNTVWVPPQGSCWKATGMRSSCGLADGETGNLRLTGNAPTPPPPGGGTRSNLSNPIKSSAVEVISVQFSSEDGGPKFGPSQFRRNFRVSRSNVLIVPELPFPELARGLAEKASESPLSLSQAAVGEGPVTQGEFRHLLGRGGGGLGC